MQFTHTDTARKLEKLDEIMDRIKLAQFRGLNQIDTLTTLSNAPALAHAYTTPAASPVKSNVRALKSGKTKELHQPQRTTRQIVEQTPEHMRQQRILQKPVSSSIKPQNSSHTLTPPKFLKPINTTKSKSNLFSNSPSQKVKDKDQKAKEFNNKHTAIIEKVLEKARSVNASTVSQTSPVSAHISPSPLIRQHASYESKESPFSKSLTPIEPITVVNGSRLVNNVLNHPSMESFHVVKEKKQFSVYDSGKNSHASYESKNSPFYKDRGDGRVNVKASGDSANGSSVNANVNANGGLMGIKDSIAQFQRFLKSESERTDLH